MEIELLLSRESSHQSAFLRRPLASLPLPSWSQLYTAQCRHCTAAPTQHSQE